MNEEAHHQDSDFNHKASETEWRLETELSVFSTGKNDSSSDSPPPFELKKLKIKPRSAPFPKLSGQSSAASPFTASVSTHYAPGAKPHQPSTNLSSVSGSTREALLDSGPESSADSGTENVAVDNPKKHRIQHRKTAMPPSAQQFMREREADKNKSKTKRSAEQSQSTAKSGVINLLNGFFALLTFITAAAIATLPLWSEIKHLEQLISPLPLGFAIFLIMMGICFLLRKKTTQIICGVLLLLMAVALVSIIMSVNLPATVQGWLLEYRVFHYLGCSVTMAISLVLTAAAFILNFKFSVFRLICALFLGCLAGLMPWLSPAFLVERNPLTLPSGFPTRMLADWSISDRGTDHIIWKHSDNAHNRLSFIFIANSYENDADAVSSGNMVDVLRSYLALMMKDEKLGPISSLPFAYRPDYHRYVSFGSSNQALDALVIPCRQKTGAFMVIFRLDDYPSHQSFITEFFKHIQPE